MKLSGKNLEKNMSLFLRLSHLFLILMFPFFSHAGPSFEKPIEQYIYYGCMTEAKRSVNVKWLVIGERYRVEFFQLPARDDHIDYWDENCHYQRMNVIDLKDMSMVFQRFGRYKPVYSNLTQNEYLFIADWEYNTQTLEGWYFGGKKPIKIFERSTRANYTAEAENILITSFPKPLPKGHPTCAMAFYPYDLVKITLNPEGYSHRIIKEGEWTEDCPFE